MISILVKYEGTSFGSTIVAPPAEIQADPSPLTKAQSYGFRLDWPIETIRRIDEQTVLVRYQDGSSREVIMKEHHKMFIIPLGIKLGLPEGYAFMFSFGFSGLPSYLIDKAMLDNELFNVNIYLPEYEPRINLKKHKRNIGVKGVWPVVGSPSIKVTPVVDDHYEFLYRRSHAPRR